MRFDISQKKRENIVAIFSCYFHSHPTNTDQAVLLKSLEYKFGMASTRPPSGITRHGENPNDLNCPTSKVLEETDLFPNCTLEMLIPVRAAWSTYGIGGEGRGVEEIRFGTRSFDTWRNRMETWNDEVKVQYFCKRIWRVCFGICPCCRDAGIDSRQSRRCTASEEWMT